MQGKTNILIKKAIKIALIICISNYIHAQEKTLQNSDFTTTSSCSYIAAPQGFQIHVINGTNASGYPKNHLVVESIRPRYYDNATYGVNCPSYGNLTNAPCFMLIGTQNNNIGIFGTNSFAHDPDGNFILGDVYLIKNRTYGQNPYLGNGFILEFSGHEALLCDDDFFYHIIKKMNQHRAQGQLKIPLINGASISYNNYAPLTGGVTTNGNGNIDTPIGHDWMNDNNLERLTAYLEANATGDWETYQRIVESGYSIDFNTIHKPGLIENLNKKGYKYLATITNANGDFIISNVLEYYAQQTTQNTQEPKIVVATAGLSIVTSVGAVSGSNLGGVNTTSFEKLAATILSPIGSTGNTTRLIFPSYLFDSPKHQAWYLGNSVDTSQFGPLTTYYNHEPLPSKCNPNNDDYIPAVFLNAHVFEELRFDWRYLTTTNFNTLKAKGFDLEAQYLNNFSLACGNLADTDSCMNQLMTVNPNLRRLPIYPTSITQISNHQSSVKAKKLKVSRGKKTSKKVSDQKKLPTVKEKPKPILLKTEAYYQDLIENKLFTMNPAFSKTDCIPKAKSIASERKKQ